MSGQSNNNNNNKNNNRSNKTATEEWKPANPNLPVIRLNQRVTKEDRRTMQALCILLPGIGSAARGMAEEDLPFVPKLRNPTATTPASSEDSTSTGLRSGGGAGRSGRRNASSQDAELSQEMITHLTKAAATSFDKACNDLDNGRELLWDVVIGQTEPKLQEKWKKIAQVWPALVEQRDGLTLYLHAVKYNEVTDAVNPRRSLADAEKNYNQCNSSGLDPYFWKEKYERAHHGLVAAGGSAKDDKTQSRHYLNGLHPKYLDYIRALDLNVLKGIETYPADLDEAYNWAHHR
jgi:hypothetical protein